MFADLSQEDIISAIESLYHTNQIGSLDYGVWFRGKTFSSKEIIYKVYSLRGSAIDRRAFNTDQAQKRLLQLGFPIVKIDSDFFSEKELYSFSELVKRPVYDSKNPVDRNIGYFLNQVVWEKTRRWAHLVKGNGWRVKGAKHWNEQDKKGQRYKQYTWYKVYPKEGSHELLYFTVGVHTDGRLLYKLDIQKNDPFFTDELKSMFYSFTKSNKANWETKGIHELSSPTWDGLKDMTLTFFLYHLETYKKAKRLLWPEDKRLMRLTWNTREWKFPIGHPWDKKNQGKTNIAYEHQYGYGHEEWLFNERYRIAHYQYGYIRGVDHMSAEAYLIDNVVLFTINPETKERLIIGEIKNIQIIEGDESEIALFKPLYEQYYQDMIDELKEVEADYKHFKKEGLFPNVKFKINDVTLYSEPIASEYLKADKFKRFQPYKIDEEIESALYAEIEIAFKLNFKSGKASTTDSFLRATTRSERMIIRKHTKITEDLYRYLLEVKNYRKSQVSVEQTKIGGACVDVAILEDDEYIVIEAKTNNVGLKNIRQALGQAFEYAFLDQSVRIKKLVIVGPAKLNKLETKYLKRLREILTVPLEYWFYNEVSTTMAERFSEV